MALRAGAATLSPYAPHTYDSEHNPLAHKLLRVAEILLKFQDHPQHQTPGF